jgi:hypothetical protein
MAWRLTVQLYKQRDSVTALQTIVREDNGHIDQASAETFIALASEHTAEDIRKIEGVLSVQLIVSDEEALFCSFSQIQLIRYGVF